MIICCNSKWHKHSHHFSSWRWLSLRLTTLNLTYMYRASNISPHIPTRFAFAINLQQLLRRTIRRPKETYITLKTNTTWTPSYLCNLLYHGVCIVYCNTILNAVIGWQQTRQQKHKELYASIVGNLILSLQNFFASWITVPTPIRYTHIIV